MSTYNALEDVRLGKLDSAKDFILNCSSYKPMDYPYTYYVEKVDELEGEIARYKGMTTEDAQTSADNEHWYDKQYHENEITKFELEVYRYNEILRKVEKWKCHSEEQAFHKAYCLKQLDGRILHSQWHITYHKEQLDRLQKKTGEEWIQEKISSKAALLQHNKDLLRDELKRREIQEKQYEELEESLTELE